MTTNSKTAARARAGRRRSEAAARKRAERDACAVLRGASAAGGFSPARAPITGSAPRAAVLHAISAPSTNTCSDQMR